MSPAPGDATNCNIARFLTSMAEKQPDALAIALPIRAKPSANSEYQRVSYRELDQRSDEIAHALAAAGIEPGMPTALMVKPGPEFFALTFAMAKLGAVPIVVDPGIGLKNIKTCLAEAAPVAFIGIPRAHAARKLLGWGKATLRHLVTVSGHAWFGGVSLATARQQAHDPERTRKPFPLAHVQARDMAAILFTSGSTGVPKGAVYTHGNFAAQVEALRRISGVTPGEVDLPTLPVFALFDPALGMSTIVPDMDPTRPAAVDPRKLVSAIQQFSVTNMFASPAVLNVLARHVSERDIALPSLTRVVCAGAPVQPAIMDRILPRLGAGARIVTPYGATEALPVCAVDSRELLRSDIRQRTANGAGVLLGDAIDEVEISIIQINDGPLETWPEVTVLAQGEIGEIVVRGAMVTASYRNRPQATQLAKIQTPQGLAHRMGDLGYQDKHGKLWFCGRMAHRVQTADETLYPVPCEMVFNTHPEVYRTALVGIRTKNGIEAALCVELEPEVARSARARITAELVDLGATHESTRAVKHICFHTNFPVDIRHNAKINRPQLALWAQRKLR